MLTPPTSCISTCSTAGSDTRESHGAEYNPSAANLGFQLFSGDDAPQLGPSLPLTKENLLKKNQTIDDDRTEDEKIASSTQEQSETLTNNLKDLGVDIPSDYVKRMTPTAMNVTPMKRFLVEVDPTSKQAEIRKRNDTEDLGFMSRINEIAVSEEEDLSSLSPKGPTVIEEGTQTSQTRYTAMPRD